MAEDKNNKNAAESFGDIFESFGAAAKESARTLGSRFKDEEVKARFREVGKAAQDFGRRVADVVKEDKKN